MDKSANTIWTTEEPAEAVAELRAARRYTLLIRAARLTTPQGEFVCVIRDVSDTGVSVRLFHALPPSSEYELHMPAGAVYPIRNVWQRDNEAGFEFAAPVNVQTLISEASEYPKRGLRLGLCFPVSIKTLAGTSEAYVENLSQQGARIDCAGLYAIDQTVRMAAPWLEGPSSEVRAKIRWRRGRHYGLVFDDTFTLGEFARFAARVQIPRLLEP